ncbi:thymidine kinase [Brachybacterium sp. J144]|uniref:thymidine kinase n=1 Tax=Brachybacterium sp. J144 TaxID=3116487 RepID=UPI002E79ABBF|nr:thymidine kinase [Brachybacterium sp. J144]MEE1652040.1 thymidine kinase [Brachybacterium sp. J144]
MHRSEAGRLHVIAGPMFAGKTEELLRRVRRSRLAGARVEVIGHALDTRAGVDRLRTHLGASLPARMMSDPAQLAVLLTGEVPDLVAIDEVQFFGAGVLAAIDDLLDAGVQVEAAGLCVTYDGEPFEPVPALMAVAEEVVRLTAVCAVCGRDAAFHVRLAGSAGDPHAVTAEQVGGIESYQARCRTHRSAGDGAPRR